MILMIFVLPEEFPNEISNFAALVLSDCRYIVSDHMSEHRRQYAARKE